LITSAAPFTSPNFFINLAFLCSISIAGVVVVVVVVEGGEKERERKREGSALSTLCRGRGC